MHSFTHTYQCKEKLSIQTSITVNKDSAGTTSYLHKQYLNRVFSLGIYLQGLKEIGNRYYYFPNTCYVATLVEETETTQNKGKTTVMFLQ